MIQLPPSKSIGARYLVATFFAGTLPADPIFDENDDLYLLQQALLEVYSDEEPIDYGESPIDVGASGTALRFVTAVCASTPGADYVINGTPRLMERPMADMLDLLRKAGAGIAILGENGKGPYKVTGKEIEGGDFSIKGDISSQFISALMLVAPYWKKGLNLSFITPLVSRPYVEMTAKVMQNFGIRPELTEDSVKIKPGKYNSLENFVVEADWSSASFFYEAVVLGAKDIELAHLVSPENSLQGDSVAAQLFQRLGVKSKFNHQGAILSKEENKEADFIEYNFSDCPDLLLPFAVAALCEGKHFKFTGIGHLREKESDRIDSLVKESRKLGFVLTEGADFVVWQGEQVSPLMPVEIDPHDDHRVAMSFAMAALKFGDIRIQNPRVVEKSFIDFWNTLPQVGLSCKEEAGVMVVTKL